MFPMLHDDYHIIIKICKTLLHVYNKVCHISKHVLVCFDEYFKSENNNIPWYFLITILYIKMYVMYKRYIIGLDFKENYTKTRHLNGK